MRSKSARRLRIVSRTLSTIDLREYRPGLGVAKINVNTELRRAYRAAALALANDPPAGDSLVDLLAPVIDAVQAVALQKIRTFALSDDPSPVTP